MSARRLAPEVLVYKVGGKMFALLGWQNLPTTVNLKCDPDRAVELRPPDVHDARAELKRERGMAMALITHDLGVIAGIADHVVVMYAGRIVERGPVAAVLKSPRHPYTEALLASMPRVDEPGHEPLQAIAGQPPNPRQLPTGCAFRPRCSRADAGCEVAPKLIGDAHRAVGYRGWWASGLAGHCRGLCIATFAFPSHITGWPC